jgi:Arm DNA-binding domain
MAGDERREGGIFDLAKHVPQKRRPEKLYEKDVYSKGPGRHADGCNLYLAVDQSGARRWVFLYERQGRQREAGLGPVHLVDLDSARIAAHAMRLQLRAGIDPIDAKKVEKKISQNRKTFLEILDKEIAKRRAEWRDSTENKWRRNFALYAPSLSDRFIDEITRYQWARQNG